MLARSNPGIDIAATSTTDCSISSDVMSSCMVRTAAAITEPKSPYSIPLILRPYPKIDSLFRGHIAPRCSTTASPLRRKRQAWCVEIPVRIDRHFSAAAASTRHTDETSRHAGLHRGYRVTSRRPWRWNMTSAHTRREVRRDTATGRPRRTTGASIVLGIGLGGFVDGILLHQLLQWHHMLTSTDSDNVGIQYYPRETVHGLQLNTMWDDCSMLSPGSWCSPAWRCCTRASSTPGAGCGPPECCGDGSWSVGGCSTLSKVWSTNVLGIHHVRSGPHQPAWDLEQPPARSGVGQDRGTSCLPCAPCVT